MKFRIGLLTGGGDVPGLNTCIKAIVHRAENHNVEVIGIRRGWAGLLNYNIQTNYSNNTNCILLNKVITRKIDRSGGTFLHTSRTNPSNLKKYEIPKFLKEKYQHSPKKNLFDLTYHILKVIKYLKLDGLISIGGDDTQSYALRLHNEGIPVIAIPKTMDNDIVGTDYCIGFSTAITRSVNFITALRTVAGSHERIAIIELFGRNSGETSLISAYLAGVDRAIISEVPFDPEKLASLLNEDKKNNPSNYALMTISEGASIIGRKIIEYGEENGFGHRKLGGIGAVTEKAIKKILGVNTFYQQVAYLMRSGEPDALDRMVANCYANLATELVINKEFGQIVVIKDGKYSKAPLEILKSGVKRVDVKEFYDEEQYRPKIANMYGKPMFLY